MTSTELGYLSGVTSNIQDQLNGKVGYSTATPNIRNAMYSNISTGWLMRDDMFDADGNYIQIGFDRTTGIYAYINGSQLWNVPLDKNTYFNMGDNVTISKVIESSTESSSGMLLDIKDFSSMTFTTGTYQMYRNGEIDNTWDKNPWTPSRIVLENNYSFEKVELDSNYYVMFKIYDVDNLYTYSDLVQIK